MVSSLSLDVEYIFDGFQHFFFDDCTAVSCDFGVFVRRGHSSYFVCVIENTIYILSKKISSIKIGQMRLFFLKQIV